MSINNDISKSNDRFINSASGIKFALKGNAKLNGKKYHNEFYQNTENSYDIEFEERPLGGKYKNESNFRPSTKQTVDQNKYKKMKEKYEFDKIEENIEEEQQKDEKEKEKKSKDNKDEESGTPQKRVKKNIYTEQFKLNKNKIILDEDEEEEIDIKKNNNNNKKDAESDSDKDNNNDKNNNKDNSNDSNESDKEEKEEKNNKRGKCKKNEKKKNRTKKSEDYDYKESKGIKSEGGDFDHNMNFGKKKLKTKKWNEEEYQKLISESKNYTPFKDYDINKFILTLYQMNNIKHNRELYSKYNQFLSLKKKQDKIQFDTLVKNILLNFNSICKKRNFQTTFKVNSLFKNQDFSKFEYKSSEKTAYFDIFISFISMYVSNYETFIESTSILDTNKLVIPLHALAFIFSSQLFFCDIARLIQNYYDRFLSYKIIPIYTKQNEEYIQRINSRHIIWKQFETPFKYYKNNKKLYLKDENGESKIDEKKVEEFQEIISQNITNAYNNFAGNIIEKHKNINVFNFNDKKISNLFDTTKSIPSSLYNQINGDIMFKLKMNLYKYKMRQLKVKKLCKLNEAMIKKSEFENTIKNKIFKQSIYYMSPCDVVQDFLEN